MKKTMLFLLMGLALAACQKTPDAPAPVPSPAAGTNPPAPLPPAPPPVTNCQGGTVMYSMPIDSMPDNPVPNTKNFVIPGFELSCGDSLQVFFRNPGVPPGTPWTLIHEGANGASYWTVLNQTVTVHNSTGNTVDVSIEAVLK